MFREYLSLLLLACLVGACANAGEDRILSVSGTATVTGTAFHDIDGSLVFGEPDLPIDGATVALVFSRAPDTVAVAQTSSNGSFTMLDVPVGQFRVVVDESSIADSLDVVNIASQILNLSPSDEGQVNIAVGFPAVLARVIYVAEMGYRMFAHGSVTSATQTFGDSTLHLADSSGSIRVVGIRQGTAAVGDSVRVRGVVAERDGERVLDQAAVFGLGTGRVIAPEPVSTSLAANADTVRLAASLVAVADAVIEDTASVDDDFHLTVNDGTGPLTVVLDASLAVSRDPFVPEAAIDLAGVLVGASNGRVLKPRGAGDMSVVVSAESVAEVRTGALGRNVVVSAIAQHATSMFTDTILHIQDATGTIRVFGELSGVDQGDSVIVRGITGTRDGQRVLREGTVTVVGDGTLLPVSASSSDNAANAGNGSLDARVVRVTNAQIQSVTAEGESMSIVVDDGSGALTVSVLDATGIDTSPFEVDRIIRATGVLVPAGSGVWRLLPRVQADVDLVVETATVAQARAGALGRDVEVSAVAQHHSVLFADTLQHIQDGTGTIRVVGQMAGVDQGDSIIVRGITATRDGQRVLVTGTATVVGTGSLSPVSTQNTGTAATASSGSLDARVVRINDAQVQSMSVSGSTTSIVVDDGSGDVTIAVLDASGIDPSPFSVNRILTATGILVPSGPGTWSLVTRGSSDIAIVVESATISEAKAGALGRDVEIGAVAEHASILFADTLQHVQDGTGSIRVFGAVAAVDLADSVVVRGRTALRAGQRVLVDATISVVGAGTPRSISTIATQTAATANNGAFDAEVHRVNNAVVQDTSTNGTTKLIVVNDGSGSLTLAVHAAAGISTAPYVPGMVMAAQGVLVTTDGSVWQLVPRVTGDLSVVVPFLTIQGVRAALTNTAVVTAGVALNESNAFGDGTAHIMDPSGTVRVSGLASTVGAGDSVRIRGTVQTSNGQPILASSEAAVLAATAVPAPTNESTTIAAAADGGQLDAALVRVENATITARATSGNDVLLTVTDGSGPLVVRVDGDAGINGDAFLPGAIVHVTGLLVPSGGGVWSLKPRTSSDLTVVVPVVSIFQARSLSVGSDIVIAGRALNSWNVFEDAMFHVRGEGAAIRVELPSTTVAPGDSVRIRGVVGQRDGQPVLEGTTFTGLGAGSSPTGIGASTQEASTGQYDAELVRITNAEVSSVTPGAEGIEVVIDNGTAPVVMLLDSAITFVMTDIVPTADLTVNGLVTPVGAGWVVKPRSNADITRNN